MPTDTDRSYASDPAIHQATESRYDALRRAARLIVPDIRDSAVSAANLAEAMAHHIDALRAVVVAHDAMASETGIRTPYDRRAALLGRLQRWAQLGRDKAKGFIESGGYESLSDINSRATDADIELMHNELDQKGIG